jgi:hypothetical protein
MNLGIGTVAAQFLSWDYLFRMLGLVSLQCMAGYGDIKSESLSLGKIASLSVR